MARADERRAVGRAAESPAVAAPGVVCAAASAAERARVVTGATKRYPRRCTVAMYCGRWGVSPKVLRIWLILPFNTPSLTTAPAIVLLTAVALSFVGLGFVMPLRALYAREIGASSVEVGLMATSLLLASFAVTPAMGWLSDRAAYRDVLALSLLAYACLLAGRA